MPEKSKTILQEDIKEGGYIDLDKSTSERSLKESENAEKTLKKTLNTSSLSSLEEKMRVSDKDAVKTKSRRMALLDKTISL